MNKENIINKCMHCKWRALGSYDIRYGGRPIGCCKPRDQIKKTGWCFEEMEETDDDQRKNYASTTNVNANDSFVPDGI